jgi:hypothetical protein
MKRRTYDVDKIKEEGNRLLACSYGTPDYRLGVATMMEWILMRAEQYHGFRYLLGTEVPDGEKPGIIWEEDQQGRQEPNFVGADETRRYYF